MSMKPGSCFPDIIEMLVALGEQTAQRKGVVIQCALRHMRFRICDDFGKHGEEAFTNGPICRIQQYLLSGAV
jgi:hypothetical protein